MTKTNVKANPSTTHRHDTPNIGARDTLRLEAVISSSAWV